MNNYNTENEKRNYFNQSYIESLYAFVCNEYSDFY